MHTEALVTSAGSGAALLHLAEYVPEFRDTMQDAEEKMGTVRSLMHSITLPDSDQSLSSIQTDVVVTLAGGGAALLHLAEYVPEFRDTMQDAEEKMGAEIVRKALFAPARLIAKNAGVDGDVIIERVLGKSFATGYNAVRASDYNLNLVGGDCVCVLGKSFATGYNAVRALDINFNSADSFGW